MPCRNDYDPPSQAQQANRVAARLLIVLNNKQNHLSSTQLLVDSTNTYLETDYVKVLCERLTEMNAFDRDALLYGDARDASARELATWWEEHLERDRKRKAEEAVESPAWPAEPNPHAPFVNLQWAWDLADQSTQAGSIIGTLVNESRLLRKRIEFLRKPGPDTARAREEREHFKKALHGISLASQNSSSSKEECGRIASKALEEARQWRIKAVEEQSAWTQRMAAVEDASASDPTAPVIGTPLVNVPATQMVGGKAIDDAMEIAERLALRLVFRNNTRTDSGYESADIAANEVRKELRAALESLAAPRQAEAGPGRHWWPVSKGHPDNVCAAAPQQAEPVAQIGWADEFGNLFPMAAWKPAQRTHHDSHKTAWRPVFLHPPAAEVQTAPKVIRNDDGNYVIEGSPPAGPLLDALLAQCELKAEAQRLRDAASALCGALTASELNDMAYHALNALRRCVKGANDATN